MNNKIKTYYIPVNPNIKQGTIYTLYLTNNNNLDLTQIIEDDKTTLNNIITPFKENKIIIEEQTYNHIIQLTNKIEDTINNKTINTQKYMEEEKKYIEELTKLNIECQNLIKNSQNERKI